MANEAVTESGQVWSGLATAGAIPQVLRKQGVDEGAKLTYLTRKWNSFTWMLHNNLRSSQSVVNDRIFLTREIDELDRFYTVVIPTGATVKGIADTNHQWIGLPNSEAAQVQPQTIVYIKNLFATVLTNNLTAGNVIPSSGGVLGANIGPDFEYEFSGKQATDVVFSRIKGEIAGTYYTDPEQCLVLEKGAKDSGGAGLTMIKLERCYMGNGAKDKSGHIVPRNIVYGASTGIKNNIATGNHAAQIKQGDVILRAMPAYWEGSNYPEGVFKNPVSDTNFTQLYKYAVSKTLESDIPATWIKERPFDIYKWVTLLRMNRDREYNNLLARKGTDTDAEGKEIYVSGGVREFIPKDSDHYLVYPNATLSWPALLDMSKPLLNLNGSGNYWGITGVSLDIALRRAFWDTHLFYNKEESKKFNMEVKTLVLAGVEINLIVSQIFEEAGFGDELMCLDMGEGNDSFEPVTNKGWDYKTDKNISEPGSNLYKEGIQGMFGLRRRKATRHAIYNFSNAVTL
jgi:hypothetical protein